MAMIYYGWGDVLKNKQFMGYSYCERCNDFQPYYLSKLVFRVHISYIPIFWKNKGYYITCNSCKLGRSLSKQEFRDLKQEYGQMTKSQAKKCFKDICRMCDALDGCNETNVNYVMEQLAVTYPINANQTLRDHYHELVAMRLEVNEQMKRNISQQPLSYTAAPALQQTGASMPQVNANTWTCSCGAVNNAQFCADCGAERSQNAAAPAAVPTMDTIALPESMKAAQPAAVTVCPRCGREDLNAPFFCAACGSPMNGQR